MQNSIYSDLTKFLVSNVPAMYDLDFKDAVKFSQFIYDI